jgi:hypothetical protein
MKTLRQIFVLVDRRGLGPRRQAGSGTKSFVRLKWNGDARWLRCQGGNRGDMLFQALHDSGRHVLRIVEAS